MSVHIIKLREPANLGASATFNSPGVPTRGCASITFIVRAPGDADQLASISIERSGETRTAGAVDAWQTSLPAIMVEVGDAIAVQTLNNSTGGTTAAGRARMCYCVAPLGGCPFAQMRINLVNGAAQIDNLEVWAVVCYGSDSSPTPQPSV